MGLLSKREPNFVIVEQPSPTEYVTRKVEVHEHRAPTDESVKLLREMEAKAEAEISKSVAVGNTSFECVIQQAYDMLSDCLHTRAVFKLNGKHMTAWVESNPRERKPPVTALRDKVAQVIAAEVLNDAFVALMRERFK